MLHIEKVSRVILMESFECVRRRLWDDGPRRLVPFS